jgi:hypothetical protein
MEALLNMKAGDTKNVDIPFSSGKAFNNISDRLYGKNLFYQIHLQKILVDASELPTTLFDLPLFIPFVIFSILLIIALIVFRIRRFSSTHDIFGLKKKCYSCKGLANVQCGNSGCNSPYCKVCFAQNNGCQICGTNSMVPLR